MLLTALIWRISRTICRDRREEFSVAETVNLWEPKILKTVIITKEGKPIEQVHQVLELL
jgi:hypothetical protein